MMGTADVRIETRLNKHMWSQGIRYSMLSVYSCTHLLSVVVAVLSSHLKMHQHSASAIPRGHPCRHFVELAQHGVTLVD